MSLKNYRLFGVVFGFGALLLLTLYAGHQAQAATNLIPNATLEATSTTPGAPLNWHAGGWGTNQTTFTYPVAGDNSPSAAKIQITNYTNGDAKWYFDPVNVTAGDTLTYTDRYMSDVPTVITVEYHLSNGTLQYVDLASPAASATWAQAQATFTVPTGVTSLTIFHLINKVGSLTVDNFSLDAAAAPPPPPPPPPVDPNNLVSNGNFESPSSNASIPQGWVQGSWGTNQATFSYPVAGDASAAAAKIQITSYTNGDAKWYFTPVAVTPGDTLQYSDNYISDVQTHVTAEYHLSNGTVQYVDLASPAASAAWGKAQATFTVPANVTSLSIFHLINQVGSLTLDNVTISKGTPPPPPPPPDPSNLIPNGTMETPSPTDPTSPQGWSKDSWGTNTAAFNYPVAGNNSANAAKIQITSYTNGDAKWGFAPVTVTPGDTLQYTDDYISNVQTYLTVEYHLSNGTLQYVDLATPAANTTWGQTQVTFTVPANVTSLSIYHLINKVGSLTIDNAKLAKGTPPPPPPPQDPNNLIPNASLAPSGDPTLPTGWSKDKWGTNQATFIYPTAGPSGNALQLQVTSYVSGDAKWSFNPISVTPGAIYHYSETYVSSAPTFITVQYDMGNGTFSYQDLMTPAAASTWTPLTLAISPPAGAQKMTIFHLLNRVGTLVTSGFVLTQSTTSSVFPQGMVSLSFDDGYLSQYDVARPILNAAGIKGTFFIVSSYLDGSDPFYMTQAQMLQMNQDGHEIGAHTKTHPFLSQLTPAQMQDEIAGSKADLLAMGATPVSTFAYPYGDYNATVVQTVQNAGFIGARSVNAGYNDKLADKYLLMDQHVENTVTPAQIQSYIDQAVANKTWLILELHQQDYSGDQYSNTPETLQAIVDYIKQKNVKTVTVSEGMALMNQ
jgi:peptidoglycan/xylan/chitin deacetylase (PgdA/CDA1 family)